MGEQGSAVIKIMFQKDHVGSRVEEYLQGRSGSWEAVDGHFDLFRKIR